MAQTQKVLFQLVVEDVNLGVSIEQARNNIRNLNKEIRANPGPERMRELVAELGKNKRELSELTKEQRALNREFQQLKVPKDSLAGLRLEYGRLAQAIAKLSAEERKSDFGKSLIKSARDTKKEIDNIEQSIGRFTGNVGNYRSALNGVGQAFAALGITASVGEIIRANTRVSDSIADVAKTAGITIQEAQRLADALEFRDTRTSLVDQLQIAQIGGQLGVAADQLQAFTESVDVLNVSLGDQFGSTEEITRVIAGLRNVLTDFKTDDISGDILHLGNALNFLEAEGNATAPAIAEFVNRISGAAIPLGLTTDQIFGLSTALAELQISPERGATAINILLAEIAKAPNVFAKSLNLPVEDFNKLVREDLLGALALVSEKVTTGAIDNVAFAQTLDELGIGRQGAIEVFGKLGGNIELLNTRVAQSTDALKGTDSVYAEFDKKNNNAAAAVEKLQNAIVNLISSEGAQEAIESVAKALTGLIEVFGEALKIIGENKTEFAALGAAIFALTGPGQRLATIMAELNAITRTATLGIAGQTAATELQTIATRAQTIATNILAAAQKALPLLALIAGIYAVVKAFESYNDSLSAAEKASNAVADAQAEIARSSADEITALNASISVLESATSSQEARAAAIQKLNDKYPEYLKSIDLEKQSAAQLTVIQRELTDEIIRGAAARAKASAQAEVSTKIVEKELSIAELVEQQSRGVKTFSVAGITVGIETEIERRKKQLQVLRDELDATGKKFDEVFKLDRPVQSSAVTVIDPEVLKNITKISDEQLAELDKLGVEQAKAEVKRRKDQAEQIGGITGQQTEDEKRAAEKTAKDRERRDDEARKSAAEQAKRITEIQRSVRELNVTEEDAYSRRVTEIENRRTDEIAKNEQRLVTLREAIRERTGKDVTVPVREFTGATKADITEADLIDQETAAINAAFDRQRAELKAERDKTAAEQTRALEALRLEVQQIATENVAALASANARIFEAEFQAQREGLKREFEGRNVVLLESLKSGQIDQGDFEKQSLANQIEFNNRSVAIEVDYAGRVTQVAEDVKTARIAAAEAARDTQLQAIEDARRADVEDLTKEGGDSAAQAIAETNRKAAEEAISAQRKFSDEVGQATADAEQAQLNGIDRVNESREAAHQAELARIRDEAEARKQLIDAAIDAAGQIAGSVIQIQQNQNRQETEAQLEALDEQYEAKIEAAKGNTKLQEKLEKELASKKEQVQKQSAEKEKRLSIIQSIINTAVAITKALPNVVLAAFAAAVGLAQTAIIAKQQFAEGGFDKKEQGRRTQPTAISARRRKEVSYPFAIWKALPSVRGGFTGGGLSYKDETGHRVAGKLPSGAVVHAREYVNPAWQVGKDPEIFNAMDRARRAGLPVSEFLTVKNFAEGGFDTVYLHGHGVTESVFAPGLSQGGFSALPPLPAYVRARPLQGGGFSDPVIGLPSASQLNAQSISVQAQAGFSDAQVDQIARVIAAENGRVLKQSLADGLNDSNRRLEREASLDEQRTV